MIEKSGICPRYCGISCINGSCPNTRNIEEEGYSYIKCEDCFYYLGCEDCYFAESEDCLKTENKEKENK